MFRFKEIIAQLSGYGLAQNSGCFTVDNGASCVHNTHTNNVFSTQTIYIALAHKQYAYLNMHVMHCNEDESIRFCSSDSSYDVECFWISYTVFENDNTRRLDFLMISRFDFTNEASITLQKH